MQPSNRRAPVTRSGEGRWDTCGNDGDLEGYGLGPGEPGQGWAQGRWGSKGALLGLMLVGTIVLDLPTGTMLTWVPT